MAKKPLNPLEDPPTASSSEEDELETSEEEVSSSEEDESKDPIKIVPSASVKVTAPVKSSTTTTTTTVTSAAAENQGSDSDSGSETETDSDSETERPNSGSGKSIAVTAVKKKEDPPSSSATLALPAVKSATKRPANEGTTSNPTKRAKKVTSGAAASGEEESIKKPAFQRLWSEEDEIALLQGLIDFKGDTGKSFMEDTNGFYDFVKKSISFEVSKSQFMDKIRSLKKKFMGKEVKNGVEPSFLKAHDRKTYELSKFIWGPDGFVVESNGVAKKTQSKSSVSKSKSKKKLDSVKEELLFDGVAAASPNGKKVEVEDDDDGGDMMLIDGGGDLRKSDWFEKSFLVKTIAGFGVGEYSVKEKWSLVSVDNKKTVEEKLKLLQDKEFEFVLEKTDFLHELTSMIAEASKN